MSLMSDGTHAHIPGDLSRGAGPRMPSGLTLSVGAVSTEPVSVAEVKSFLRLDATPDVALLATMITAVREGAEKHIRRLLARRDVTAHWETFYGQALLHYPPVGAVQSVEVKRGDVYEAVPAGDYQLDGRKLTVDSGGHDRPARVTYTAGYETMPAALRLRLLQDIRAAYDHRDLMTGEASSDTSAMISADAYDQWRVPA